MTIKNFLKTMTNKEAEVTLLDAETESTIVSLKVGGYESLDDKIEAREVKKWTIVSSTAIKVVLNEYVEPEDQEDSENTDPADPSNP